MKKRAMVVCIGILFFLVANARAQTQTTGQISGTVADASGAVIPKAVISVLNRDTGLKRTTESNTDGFYIVPLLDPGNYSITVTSTGFETISREGIIVAVSHSALVDFRLKVGQVQEKVTITAQASLIEPSNPNTTTTFNAAELANIPNPGNDLSYLVNLAPGAIVNTHSANQVNGGNVEINGLPSTANNFTIDGLSATSPFGNTNQNGASGLQLGINAIREVSINTSAYSTDQGRLGAAQIEYVTKSGSNSFHGNLFEIWNGSAMNANNYFLKANGQPKPRSNVNEFGASLGGPIVRNKLFFFADLEGIRLILPNVLTSTLPTPAYQAYVLQQLPLGGTDTVLGGSLPPQPGEVQYYKNIFSLMGDTSRGTHLAIPGCPFNADGTTAAGSPPSGDGCANTRTFSAAPPSSETLFTSRLDYARNAKDSYWFRFQINNGNRTQVDPVTSLFNLVTPIPVRSAAAGWTHVFSSQMVNQFNPGISYTKAISTFSNPAEAHGASPISLLSGFGFSNIGSNLTSTPSGNGNTTWQLVDNFDWTVGKSALRFGGDFRRPLVDVAPGTTFVPLVFQASLPEFTYGAAGSTTQSFPKVVEYRIAMANLGLYAMDTIRATSKLTITLGLRADWNSDPASRQDVFSRLNGSFAQISHDVNTPLNADILTNQEKLYPATQLIQWQPRTALAYSFDSKTVVRGGFGLFGQAPEALPTFFASSNPPLVNTFMAGLFNPLGGVALLPGLPNSAIDAAVAANQQYVNNFANGGLSCNSPVAPPNSCLPPISFTSYEVPKGGQWKYPYFMQWSLALERQFGDKFLLSGRYVGTKAVHLSYNDYSNLSQTVCQGCFSPLSFTSPDARFGTVSSSLTGAHSSYNGLQLSAIERPAHGLSFQINYTYSHCLDNVSNNTGVGQQFNSNAGSFSFLRPLVGLYASCDYDIRHSLNGSYVYQLPLHSGKRWLNEFISGWQVAGTVFVRGGMPFSVFSQIFFTGFQNGFPGVLANRVPGQSLYEKNPITGVTQTGTIQWLNPNAFQSVVFSDPTTGNTSCYPTTTPQNCQDGNLGRNSLRGPGFRWTDLAISKSFQISERFLFKFDAQFYNLFNHPNFGFPGSLNFGFPGAPNAGIPGNLATLTGFGTINSTVAPLTSLLGGQLGGDSSVRMIALRGTITF